MGEWLFRELFPLKAQQIDLLYRKLHVAEDELAREKESNGLLHAKLKISSEHFDILNDALAAKELELSTLKNKIVERAQVPSTLKAKTSADVRRIVEQANEAEFEEQANGIR